MSSPLLDQRMFLGSIPLFESLNQEDLDSLASKTHLRKFPAHKIIVEQGKDGESMYLLLKGRAQVSLHLADGEDISLGELAEGEAFGEIALFDKQARTATVSSLCACELLCIQREDFTEYLMQNPHVAIELLRTMSKRLRAASDLIKDTVYNGVNHRLAETLHNIAQAYGKHSPDGIQVDIAFDDQELARIAGIPESVVKAQLQHWTRQGIIQRSHQEFTISKPQALQAIRNV